MLKQWLIISRKISPSHIRSTVLQHRYFVRKIALNISIIKQKTHRNTSKNESIIFTKWTYQFKWGNFLNKASNTRGKVRSTPIWSKWPRRLWCWSRDSEFGRLRHITQGDRNLYNFFFFSKLKTLLTLIKLSQKSIDIIWLIFQPIPYNLFLKTGNRKAGFVVFMTRNIPNTNEVFTNTLRKYNTLTRTKMAPKLKSKSPSKGYVSSVGSFVLDFYRDPSKWYVMKYIFAC